MNEIREFLSWWVGLMVGRASGPLHFRFLMMPTMVTILAIRAGLRDAREKQPGFVWMFLTRAGRRKELLRSALQDIARILVIAVAMDTAYQIIFLRAYYIGQTFAVALLSAVLPYVVFRGPISLLTRFVRERTGHGPPR